MHDPPPANADADRYDLQRFVEAQQDIHQQALAEIRGGRKQSHWMWFVFPQCRGLGFSATSRRFAISGIAEARAFLDHPVLGPRLVECFEAVLASGHSARDMFGYPDDMKLQSCATLFAAAAPELPIFQRVLTDKYAGQRDERTLEFLAGPSQGG